MATSLQFVRDTIGEAFTDSDFVALVSQDDDFVVVDWEEQKLYLITVAEAKAQTCSTQ
jgi:hypothetical protein